MRRRFRPARNITFAEFADPPPMLATQPKHKGAKAAGIRYERQVHGLLKDLYGERYFKSKWIHFKVQGENKFRWCQPDAFLLDLVELRLLLIEIKLRHCNLAWYQMKYLYLPVLEFVLPLDLNLFTVCTCEIVHWYDPAIRTDRPAKLRKDLASVEPNEFAVHILNPKRIIRSMKLEDFA